ncbi:MAG TPA: hypothetical protein VFM85_02290 [Actinomycetota bacterium]|nr:hypothetical protein [Actinomycetota bacterium]
MRFVRCVLLMSFAASLFVSLLSTPAAVAHGTWDLTVGYPQIWNGPIFGGIDGDVDFHMSENHYRIVGKVELQASTGGKWKVIDSIVNEKIQTDNWHAHVGDLCTMPTRGVALLNYYRVRLVYLRVWTQTRNLHTEYTNVYRPASYNLNYSSFCSPGPG